MQAGMARMLRRRPEPPKLDLATLLEPYGVAEDDDALDALDAPDAVGDDADTDTTEPQ